VRKIQQDLYAFLDDVMRALAFNTGYESDAAGVVFVARVIQALRRG
jgi:hypothetical protein